MPLGIRQNVNKITVSLSLDTFLRSTGFQYFVCYLDIINQINFRNLLHIKVIFYAK